MSCSISNQRDFIRIHTSPPLEFIITQLADHGFAIVPNFFELDLARQLAAEADATRERGKFKPAAVGRGEQKQILAEVRTDEVHWLNPEALSEPQAVYWNRMESLREFLNMNLFLGLVTLEAHLARFAPGGFYKPHLDRHQKSSARILSTITYLDENWQESDGGQLRIYTTAAGVEGPFIDVFPEAGKLVVFISADFWHEVRVASRPRHSVTGWYREHESVLIAAPTLFEVNVPAARSRRGD